MESDDPFEIWADAQETLSVSGWSREMRDAARGVLDDLEHELDEAEKAERTPRHDGRLAAIRHFAALSAADLPRAEELTRRVIAQGGPGGAEAQAALLEIVGRAAAAPSVPFWREMLTLTIPRDRSSRMRKRHATAALAWIVVTRGDEAAFELLLAALRARDSDLRAMAADHLGLALAVAKTRVPKSAAVAALTRSATEDAATLPRLTARLALLGAGAPVPLDLPGGSYALKVWRARDSKVYRVVELRAAQNLDDLHRAIQDAFEWDDDHLYVFWLSGKEGDAQYELGHSEMDGVRGHALDVSLGALGLPKGYTFLYLYDFGDKHLFRVKVVGTRARAGPGRCPRVVESVGAPPPQDPSAHD